MRTIFFEVAEVEGEVMAFHIVKRVRQPPDEWAGLIVSLWVDPSLRGKGIGHALKTRGETWARTGGLTHLETAVHLANQSMLALNRKAGFELFQYKLKKKL